MRLNKAIALSTGMSRRSADAVINAGKIRVNDEPARLGQDVTRDDKITVDNIPLALAPALDRAKTTIRLHKPAGYVVSRNGQGSRTIYELLPENLQSLKPIGRLDKDSSGLLLLTDDGQLAQELTHPSRRKAKVYEVELNIPLLPLHQQMINDYGIQLDDGRSQLQLERLHAGNSRAWRIVMHEGRNRQIRRTFQALGYTVTRLHRTQFGGYYIAEIPSGQYISA